MSNGISGPSFEQDVKPLFRDKDQRSMDFLLDLWNYEDVRANAEAILARLQAGTMPCDGAWPDEQVAIFQQWADGGMAP